MTDSTGAISEMTVMREYALRGYTISLPTTPARYDFLAEKAGRVVKVQVKHGTRFNGGRELGGFSKTPYDRMDVDVVAIYDSLEDTVYFIPADHVEGMKAIRLRMTPYLYMVKEEKALQADHYRRFLG